MDEASRNIVSESKPLVQNLSTESMVGGMAEAMMPYALRCCSRRARRRSARPVCLS
jgi:hypothetical protein